MNNFLIFSILLTLWYFSATAYCLKTITKENLEPITKIRAVWVPTDAFPINMPSKSKICSYLVTEKRIKYEIVNKCCAGYSMNSLGVCEPICADKRCGEFEECAEPNVCSCKRGYKVAADSIDATCLPICPKGCGQHEHCQAPNICACNEAYVSNRSDTTDVLGCQRRCRVGVLWDPITLACVERQEANVTVVAAEMNLFMADVGIKEVEDIEINVNGQQAAVVGNKNIASTTSAPGIPESKTFGCLTLVHSLILVGVTMFLLSCATVTLYILKRRQHNNIDVILQGNNDLPGEYFIDRRQILVY